MSLAGQITSLFRRGEYQKVLDLFDENPAAFPEAALSSLSGAFSMLGRNVEAEGVIERIEAEGVASRLVEARFWLGVGLLRAGQFERAEKLFLGNQKKSEAPKDPRTRFWASQGMAFLNSFFGRYGETRIHAEAALQAATRLADNYGRVLALDLLGQATIYMGEIGAGLAVLDRALALAVKEKWPNLHRPILLSRAILAVQFGRGTPALLARMRKSSNYSDSYSSAYLLLELARQSLIGGRSEECRQHLDAAAVLAFASRNRRQMILLCLRRAHLELIKGRGKQAEHYLAEAEALILPVVDQTFLPNLHDLRFRIAEAKGDKEECERRRKELLELARSSPTGVSLRILQRRGWLKQAGNSDDLVADEIDLVHARGEGAQARILESGRLFFLRKLLDVPPQSRRIYLDLEPGRVTAFSDEEISHRRAPLSRNQRKTLLAVADSLPRHAFVKAVWGYEYHPLRHDGLVYAAVNKLRAVLGNAGAWIENHPNCYALTRGVEIRLTGSPEAEAGSSPPRLISELELGSDLNHRQRKILSYLEAHEEIGPTECAKIFRVSKITACRDLSWLFRKNLVARTGKARATRYHWKASERAAQA
jgi:hypothetical protein